MAPSLDTLFTPALIVERARMTRNVAEMESRLAVLGVPLRPHVKTAKSAEVARLMLHGQPGGVTVSTLAEAEGCLSAGITDILYAVGMAPGKLDRVAPLLRRGAGITLITDSPAVVSELARRARALGLTVGVMIEIDSDGHRAGVAPDHPDLLEAGRRLVDEPGVEPAGVLTHAGASYDVATTGELEAWAERERAAAVSAAEKLRAAGVPCPAVSVGSTPTATFARDLTGVTEVRAGVYVFQDLVMAGLGVCTIDDIALSVLCSVIGHRRSDGAVIVDAGWTALSRDRGTASQPVDQGYGLVCDLDVRPIPGLVVAEATQEHGVVADRAGRPVDPARLPVGTRLRVLPNHACATGAMHTRYHVVDGDGAVQETWTRFSGW